MGPGYYCQVPSFERRVQAASTRRGWAAIRWQADDPTLDHFDIELIAKEVHVGWARALTQVTRGATDAAIVLKWAGPRRHRGCLRHDAQSVYKTRRNALVSRAVIA